MSEAAQTPKIPREIWDGTEFTFIHSAVLFASLGGAVSISGALPPEDYDELINSLHRVVCDLAYELVDKGVHIGEFHVFGDEICIYFYRAGEVADNYALDGPEPLTGVLRRACMDNCRENNSRLAIDALKTAILLKNHWLIHPVNLERVKHHHRPWELSIGLHYGWVYLRNRAEGRRRIEGYTLSVGKQIEQCSRTCSLSKIVVSQGLHDLIRSSTVKHTQLKQRIFFVEHPSKLQPHSGVPSLLKLYELKFVHRIGISAPREVIDQYEAIFYRDNSNAWAYYQLAEYYAFVVKDWNKVFELAKLAALAYPQDEKVLLDIAQYYLEIGEPQQSEEFAHQALAINNEFDLVHEHLAIIAAHRDDVEEQIKQWRIAVRLSPDSAVNNFNLGLALMSAGRSEEGYRCVEEALRIFPEYSEWQIFRETLLSLRKDGKLPDLLEAFLDLEQDATADTD